MKRIIWCQAVCLLMLLGTGHTAVAESANALVYANLADAKLHTSPGSKASINRHSAIKTPDGQNILEVICTEFQPGSTAKDIQLHVPLDERIKAGHRYELNFTCQASNTGTLSLAPSTSSPDFETKIYKGWQTVKLIFTASAEGSNNLSIKLGKLGVPTTLHLGSIAYRQLVQSPQLQNQWSVFLHATTPSSLAKIPDQLDSPNGKVQRINAPLINQALDLGQLAGSVKERNTAILFNSFQSDQAGTMRLGVSADWWMELYVNGKKEFDTMDRGNGTNRYIPDDHVVNFPVKAGENVLAVKVLSGSAGWRFVCGEPSVGISTTPLNLQAGISKAIDQQTIAGATMIAVGKDQIISNESYGYADLQTKQPLQSDALFWIASMSKPITGFAFMMLVDEGKVSLDDPVSKYIPQMNHLWVVKEKDDATMSLTRQKTPITLRHLLSHTSGLPFLSPLQWHDLSGLSLENAVISFTMNPLQFEPGTKYSYSNQGIDTVGRVIEIVSGMSYEAFLQTRIFDPLGMKDTTFFPTKEQLKRLAKSYTLDKNTGKLKQIPIRYFKAPLDRSDRFPAPGGGLFSTGPDLARFCQMLLNDAIADGKRYLSEKSMAEIRSKQTGDAVPNNYSLGFAVNPKRDGSFGHGGAYATNMTIYPKSNVALIWLVQLEGVDSGPVRNQFTHQALQNANTQR